MFVRKCNVIPAFCGGEKKSHNWRDIKGSAFKLHTHKNKTKTFISFFCVWPWVVSSHAESISFTCLAFEIIIVIPVKLPVLPLWLTCMFFTLPPCSRIFPYLFKKQNKTKIKNSPFYVSYRTFPRARRQSRAALQTSRSLFPDSLGVKAGAHIIKRGKKDLVTQDLVTILN